MALEAVHQLGTIRPTHVFLQAGVGAMAGAVTAFLCNYYSGTQKPTIVINQIAQTVSTALQKQTTVHFTASMEIWTRLWQVLPVDNRARLHGKFYTIGQITLSLCQTGSLQMECAF